MKVIFDTDVGIDDAVALLLLEASTEVDLIGVVTGFGNASVEVTTRNGKEALKSQVLRPSRSCRKRSVGGPKVRSARPAIEDVH